MGSGLVLDFLEMVQHFLGCHDAVNQLEAAHKFRIGQ